jgi:hypothetical protein
MEYTSNGARVNFQVSRLGDITGPNFEIGLPFLVKNTTDEPIKATVIPQGQEEQVETTFFFQGGILK